MSQLIIHLVRFCPPINLYNAISSIILIGSPTLRCCSLIGRGWVPDSGASQVRAESSDGGKKTKDVWFSVQKVSSFNLRHYILLCRASRRGGKSCSTPPWSGLLEPSSLMLTSKCCSRELSGVEMTEMLSWLQFWQELTSISVFY